MGFLLSVDTTGVFARCIALVPLSYRRGALKRVSSDVKFFGVVNPPMRRGVQLIERKPCEYHASDVCWGMLTGRHPAPQPIQTKKQQWQARFGGPFLWAKKSPHGFMQARQLHLDFVPVYVFLSGSRKILSRIHFVNNGFKSQGHAFAWLFYYQVPQESSSTCFVVKSSLTGLTPFKTQRHP